MQTHFGGGRWYFESRSLNHSKQHGATLYTIQLGLNLIWTPLFFALKRPIEATVDTVALTGTVGYLTYIWSQIDPVAAWVMVPYLGWLSFATYLSVSAIELIWEHLSNLKKIYNHMLIKWYRPRLVTSTAGILRIGLLRIAPMLRGRRSLCEEK